MFQVFVRFDEFSEFADSSSPLTENYMDESLKIPQQYIIFCFIRSSGIHN